MIANSKGGTHSLLRLINNSETYGRHIVRRFALKAQAGGGSVVDFGAGLGDDLRIAKSCGFTKLIAIEGSVTYARALAEHFDEVHVVDIERDSFSFLPYEGIDLIIANQVLEHTKDIFYIFHAMFTSLKIGGHLILGVPNVLSFHNRLLAIFGRHPTQHKLASAHVRVFSSQDTRAFFNQILPGKHEIVDFCGSQFYPFPRPLARLLSRTFPASSFSIFFLIKKTAEYSSEFLSFPIEQSLETAFYLGDQTMPDTNMRYFQRNHE